MNWSPVVIASSWLVRLVFLSSVSFGIHAAAQEAGVQDKSRSTQEVAWQSTNGPAVFNNHRIYFTNWYPGTLRSNIFTGTNTEFDHYIPTSLNHLIWTNFLAHTNGRSTLIWNTRSHPPDWPRHGPQATWNTNCLMWGMRGLTALSPCWQGEGAHGQVPVTALTRRHGYTRGHEMGPDGFSKARAGYKVWFVSATNTLVQATIVREVVRTRRPESQRDYTLFLFDKDLPISIEPLRVVLNAAVNSKYRIFEIAPSPFFLTEQSGNVSAQVKGWMVDIWKGGDSGSPNLLPMPGELVFRAGRSTSDASPEMQKDMDALCIAQGLNPAKYQLQWLDISAFPSY